MEDNSQTEQVVDIINLIETTLPATSVPETTTEATILNLPFTEGVVLIGALVILVLVLLSFFCLYQLYWEEIEAKIYGRRSTEENILCQKPRHGFSTTPVGRLEKLRRQMKFIEEVPLEERVKKQSNIQID
ncbi:hypothetical protein T4A_8039 [Trichinella pseudospiralis]|uniref:Uncharacterized protein n=1 Tax=Trichinella pseudospiralis TaxID=6337 RepID=A0A0V1FUZ6_TRIPS|nr:hypothetical protein T4E_7713 [Trichinella pseudospiralis]KRY77379.1 hypothetical protein T4A_8039 [Trichinella pseudospiralis]KRY89850.1 hypothetical protein T4D_11811 [Trichinella pseudospiralis]KRZ44625.1 hypothetical protein T4C_10114 [Trichinella pseudospiralis]